MSPLWPLLLLLLFSLRTGSAESGSGPGGAILRFEPAYGIPLGAETGVFGPLNLGGSLTVGFASGLFGLPWLEPELGLGYSYTGLATAGSVLSSFEGRAGLGAGFPLAPILDLRAALHARYAWYSLVQGSTTTGGGSPGVGLELGGDFRLNPALSLGFGVSGGYDFGLLGFLRPYLAAVYQFGSPGRGGEDKPQPESSKPTTLSENPGPAPAVPTLVLRFEPAYGFPLGAEQGVFGPMNLGAGFTLGLGSGLFGLDWLSPELGLGFSQAALSQADSTLDSFEARAGLGASLPLLPWLDLRSALYARFAWYNLVQGGTKTGGGSPGLGLDVGGDVGLGPRFSLGLGLSGGYDLGMLGFLRPHIAAIYRFTEVGRPAAPQNQPPTPRPLVGEKPAAPKPSPAGGPLVANLDGIFPVYYKFYDDHPFGSLTLTNTGKADWTEIALTLSVRQIMDAPKLVATLPKLSPGESRKLDATALFNESVLEITEATKLACELSLGYREGGKLQTKTQNLSLRVYDRNALTWSDDRSAAAFVTAKDPLILTFAKNLAGEANRARNPAINAKLQMAALVHDALCLYGVNYVTDPTSVFAGAKAKADLDFLQFPRQTLEYKAGDCDDLAILYAAFLEAIGIETAFITVPGHIYVAASLDLDPEQARSRFGKTDDFILREGKTWLPLEITIRQGGFLPAWTEGAREWRESSARGQAALVPIHQAWELYEPVALPGSSTLGPMPTAEAVKAMRSDIEDFVNRDMAERAAKLQSDIRKTQGASRSVNALGLLYAQYGLYDRARTQFETILSREEYVPALVNLGNICKLQGSAENALAFYERAYKVAPTNAAVLLAAARTNQELENYGVVRKYYQELRKVDPTLAERYSFLDLRGEEGSKAAEAAGLKDTIDWMEGK